MFAYKYYSNSGTIPTSLEVAYVTGRLCYFNLADLIPGPNLYHNIKIIV